MSYQVRNARRAKAHFPATPRWQIDRDTERGPVFCTLPTVPGEHGFSTLEVLRRFCELNNLELEHTDKYGEPGYTDPPEGKCILFANWNDVPASLQKRVEAQGYELEWSDEWYVDHDRSPAKAWRTQPDGWDWEPRTRLIDGHVLTPDDDPQEWITDALNEPGIPLPSWFDAAELAKRGFAESIVRHDPSNRLRSVFKECRDAGYDVLLVSMRSFEYAVWTRREAKRELFLSDARGIYIPRDFAQCIDRSHISGVKMEDLDELAKGPPGGLDSEEDGSETYWDTWTEVLDNAKLTAADGTVFRLEQDGDLWLVEAAGEFCEYDDTCYTHKE